jgi:hypothetical protein
MRRSPRFLPAWGSRSGFRFSTPEFHADFADLGSGAVDTTLTRGTGSATFTRATTATTVDSAGTIVSVASGTARSWYDPDTLEYMGYLAEGARDNICLQSADIATTWTNVTSTESTNTDVAPDGTTTADRIIEDTTAAVAHGVRQSITLTAATYTFSAFAKQGSASRYFELFAGNAGAFGTFDLVNGVVGNVSNCTSAIKAYPNGWYRCSITYTGTAAAGNHDMRITNSLTVNSTYQGDGSSYVSVWGAQVELGSFASSYIPTTTASVTRNADVLTYPTSGNIVATAGAAYAEVSTFWTTAPANPTNIIKAVNSGELGGRVLYTPSSVTEIVMWDGTNAATKSGLTSMATGIRKRACSWGGALMAITGDGATVETAAFDGELGAFTASTGIGCAANGGEEWFGTIKNVRNWLVKPTDAQLQAITA